MLLDKNAQADLLSRITDGGKVEEPVNLSSQTVDVRPEQNEYRESNFQSQPQTEQQQMIPYDRFKKVNETKKEYQRRFEEQQRELEQLRKELETKGSSQESNDHDWLDELLKEPESHSDKKLKHLETRLQSFEMKEAERELGSIVKQAVKRHNDLDPELVESVIYQSIADNPHNDVDDAVDRLREFISYAQTKAVRKQPEPQQVQAQRPSAPPRPSMTGNKTYGNQPAGKPRTLADAREALYNFLKK